MTLPRATIYTGVACRGVFITETRPAARDVGVRDGGLGVVVSFLNLF